MEPRPRKNNTFVGIARWASLFGLVDPPEISNPGAIDAPMPSDDWFWCADPVLLPRIRLKKRMVILKFFLMLEYKWSHND